MLVRTGTDADAAGATAVVRQVLLEHGIPFEPTGLDADIVAPDSHYTAGGGAFYVAVDHGRIVGTAALQLTGPARGEIRKLFLLPEARGRGVGRALLGAVLDAARARAIQRLTLTTRVRYQRAIRMYQEAGFRLAGTARKPRGGDLGLSFELDLAARSVPERPAGLPRRVPTPAIAA
jgi:putative acetyltransferase